MATRTGPRLLLPVGPRDHIQGPANAPVTLVEYGDFECPYCAAAHVIIKKAREIVNDEFRFVFRHFPLTQIHPHAQAAADAAEAAGSQGRFWRCMTFYMKTSQGLMPGTWSDTPRNWVLIRSGLYVN